MRKIAIVAALGGGILAGCSTAQVQLTQTIEQDIQAAVLQQCSYSIPSLESIAAIASTFIPGISSSVTLVSTVVNAICSAEQKQLASLPPGASPVGRSLTVTVNGVSVTGAVVRLGSRYRLRHHR